MKKIIYPEKKDWMEILRRPVLNTDTLRNTVKEVLDKVKTEGDKAVREYEERFDKVKLDSLGVTETEIAEAEKEVPIELKAAIMLAQKNIHTFHSSQRFEGKKVPPKSPIIISPEISFWRALSESRASLNAREKMLELPYPTRAIAT